jgi:hypothetical protein
MFRPPARGAPRGQWSAPVEDANVIQAQEATFEYVLAEAVFAVHPPTEVQHQFRKGILEKLQVAFAPEPLFGAVQEDVCPGVHGRIHVAEVPLV